MTAARPAPCACVGVAYVREPRVSIFVSHPLYSSGEITAKGERMQPGEYNEDVDPLVEQPLAPDAETRAAASAPAAASAALAPDAEARTAETRARVENAAEVSESAARVPELTGTRMRARELAARVPDVVVITGMSGSGRTQAMHVFEDMGYFCIDNLPPRLILQLAQLVGINTGVGRHLAVTCDLRSQGLFDEISDSLVQLREHEISCKVLFLDAADSVLIRRYDENRRRHPLAQPGESLTSAIARERRQLASVRDASDLVIDTSHLKVRDLRARLHRAFSELTDQQLMDVSVFSFGFKHGMPVEADLMIDVRFLPNPFYDPKMRSLTGNDKLVSDFVLGNPVTEKFLDAWYNLLDVAMPGYVAEGKSHLSIAVGCTGGQHRSVAIANATAAYLERGGYHVSLSHRDLALANVRNS